MRWRSTDSGDLVLIANLSEAPFQMSVAGAAGNIDVIAISPNESVAAVYSLAGSRVQIIGGLPADAAGAFRGRDRKYRSNSHRDGS
jgi:hypothetical protein